LADIIFILVVLTFFALATGYVTLCDRIIGADPEADPDAAELDQLDEPAVAVTR